VVVPGEVIAYLEMCREEGVNLQRGMNFGSSGRPSVVLMSRRPAHLTTTGLKMMVVSLSTKATTGHKSGAARTQRRSTNLSAGQGARLPRTDYFLQAASQHRELGTPAECVRVYERCVLASGRSMAHSGLSMAGGKSRTDDLFKFRLEVDPDATPVIDSREPRLEQNRLIPTDVKLAVWKRDQGKCVECGCSDNLHFDHIIPYSRGGSSLIAKNIQLMCARHNLAKHDKIQ